MKAKEYAKMYNDDPSGDTILAVANGFLRECRELIASRRAVSESAGLAVLNEQNQKWQAFARLAPGVQEDGFEELVKLVMPEAYRVWKG